MFFASSGTKAATTRFPSLAPEDGDVVLVPRGFHPVSAGARHDLYYLNVMAGPVREWRITGDPDYA